MQYVLLVIDMRGGVYLPLAPRGQASRRGKQVDLCALVPDRRPVPQPEEPPVPSFTNEERVVMTGDLDVGFMAGPLLALICFALMWVSAPFLT